MLMFSPAIFWLCVPFWFLSKKYRTSIRKFLSQDAVYIQMEDANLNWQKLTQTGLVSVAMYF